MSTYPEDQIGEEHHKLDNIADITVCLFASPHGGLYDGWYPHTVLTQTYPQTSVNLAATPPSNHKPPRIKTDLPAPSHREVV